MKHGEPIIGNTPGSQAARLVPLMMTSNSVQEEAVPTSHREDRAFGLPQGSVRAMLALLVTAGWMAGTIFGYMRGGAASAAELNAYLGPTAATAIAFYFAKGDK